MMKHDEELPLVTIVSPCYNHERYIIESLNSIREQTYSNIEHIIIDDASTDDSVSLIEAWILKYNYKCTFIKHSINCGISKTLNESIFLAKGKYWSPLATDDSIVPERTSSFVSFLEENQRTEMVASDALFIDDNSNKVLINNSDSFIENFFFVLNGQDLDAFGTYDSFLRGNYMPGSLMIRTSTIKEIGGFPERMKMEDWDTWLRVSQRSKIGLINQKLTNYRTHETNTVNQRDIMIADTIRTFLGQYEYCLKNGKRDLFQKNFEEFFHNYFSIKNNRQLSTIFLKKAMWLTIKAYLKSKIKRVKSGL